jgi:signal transduction histidine kinase
MEFLADLFSSQSFMPHGHCYLWRPDVVWMQVLSNGSIAAAYIAISATLTYLVWRLRDEIPFRRMYLAFGAFIVLCGVTHVFDVYIIWRPAYFLDGVVRSVTAAVSLGTALLLPTLIPHASNLARGAKAARDRGIALETVVRDLGTMYEKSRELDELKTQFFANVSHELRTPLTLIIGPIEKMLASGAPSPEQRRDLEIVLRNARLLHRQVDDLLDAAKLDAGKLAPDYREVDVAALIRRAAGNFDGIAADRGLALSVIAPPTLTAEVDADKIERVVLNLLGNAFKFTPDGGRIRFELRSIDHAGDRRLAIVVADSGPGIPAAQRAAVFERFRQLDGGVTRRVGGVGLGLAIAREMVALHGGTISVGDAAEGGAELTVELPATAPAGALVRPERTDDHVQHRIDEPSRPVPTALVRTGSDAPTVLVVEDNPEMNRFVCEALAPEVRAVSAADGTAGLERALAGGVDLVITDVMMPGISGDELVRRLRREPAAARTPILLLTAKADDELRVRLLREGAQDYVTKPFSVEELRARVGNLVRMKRAHDVLDEARTVSEAARRELESFSYTVSHDLRAPLRALDGYCHLLLEDHAAALDAEGRGYLQRIRAATRRMNELIEGLLDLARVSRGPLTVARLDLSEMARSIVEELAAGDRDRRVEIAIQPDLAATGDPLLVRVVLQNLLANAWKFTRRADRARIEIGAAEQGGQVAFFVRDNGVGFDMAHAGQLFSAFQRLHPEPDFPGTGIGLATVQRIVARHGGTAWADSRPGAGATFWFTLAAERPKVTGWSWSATSAAAP